MSKILTASLAATFATASTLAILAGGAQQTANAQQRFLSPAPTVALADREERDNEDNQGENNRGNNGCVNPAGHTRGWCKHNGDNEDNGGKHHRNHRGDRNGTVLNGTVLGMNGNTVTYRLDNGQVITFLDNNGTPLVVGQHYSLRVYNQNGQYVLGSSNGYNNGGNGQYGNQSVSGTIAIVSGNTLTFTNGRTIDISQVNGNTNGPLSTLRSITAYGYVSNGVFYAQSIR